MSADAQISRLQPGEGSNDSTQRGCTSWLFISCIVLTMTTAFVFGWGLAAPNMYNEYTEIFLKHKDACVVLKGRQPNATGAVETLVKSESNEGVSKRDADENPASETNENAGVDSADKAPKKPEESFDFLRELVKGFPQSTFLVGAFIGALTGPMWVQFFDRKRTVFINYIFCFGSSLCVLLAFYMNKPWLFYLSRLLLGYQGGMACTIVPPFLGEISSQRVRGATGVAFQLSLTIGILVAQIFGLPFIAGSCSHWAWGLSIVFLLPFFGMFLLVLIPNSPTQMIGKYNNEEQAIADLKKLRGTNDIQADLELIREQTTKTTGSRSDSLSIIQVLKSSKYRWPMLTTVILQFAQALSGINAVFFYSSKMFEKAGIEKHLIPYANIGTGLINVLATIVAITLIEKLGRRALVIYPMMVMIFVFGILTALVEYNETRNNPALGFISVLFILIFIICFAVGLGPIPFLYSSEVCRPEARDSVQSLGLIANYIGNILLSLFFPVLNSILGGYVFLIFVILVTLHVAFLWFKMPETKNKTIDDAEKFWRVADQEPNPNKGEKLLSTSANA